MIRFQAPGLRPRLCFLQVNVLVEFLIENRGDVFGEETPGLSCPSAQESPAPVAGSTGMRRKRGLSPTGAWHTRNRNGEKTAAVGLWVGFASGVLHFPAVTLLHRLLLSRPAFGRAKWPCRQSREGPSGNSLSGCIPLSAGPPQRSWGRRAAAVRNGRGTSAPQTR